MLNATAGNFSEVESGVADPDTLLTTSAVDALDDCQAICLRTYRCLVVVFSSSDGQDSCSLYSGLRPRDATSPSSRPLAWRFHTPTLHTPPSNSMAIQGRPLGGAKSGTHLQRYFTVMDPENSTAEKTARCAEHGGILYPPANGVEIIDIFDHLQKAGKLGTAVWAFGRKTTPVYFGLDNFLNKDIRVSTRGHIVTDIKWNKNEPGYHPMSCHYSNLRAGFRVHDAPCDIHASILCEYVGKDIARGRRWIDDGNRRTVDLGEAFTIYGIRYVGDNDPTPASVRVSVALTEGQWMTCAEAAHALAAPQDTARLLTCTDVTHGRFVSVRHDGGTDKMAEDIAVFGSPLPGSEDDGGLK